MATTIIVTNETGSPLTFSQLMVPNGQIAGSGQAQVSDWNHTEEILRDEELLGFINNDQALLTVNGTALTKQQSLAFLVAPTTPVKVSYGQSSQAPGINDDANAGYSVGSVWVTTTGDTYTCVDASVGAAVWVLFATLSDEDPQPVGTTSGGTGTAASRDDHVHAHGDQAGGSLHADATYQTDGFMPDSDKHWANHAFDTGWAEGGELSYGTGFTVDVAAGQGFINDATDETSEAALVEWTATSVTATANTTGWIYVTSAGVVSHSTTQPDMTVNIMLGTVHGGATALALLSHARAGNLQQHRANKDEFFEEAFGGIATYGLEATENATPLHIDVAAGNYFIAGDKRTTTAQTNISWTYWYQDGAGGWTTVLSQNAIDTTNYDDGTGTLEALPTNKYKKDGLYICDSGDGVEFHVVYAQRFYNSQEEAEYGLMPEVPQALFEYAARFAGAVVQQGDTSILELVDEKPRLGQRNPQSTSDLRISTQFVPIQSSSSLSESTFGRQVVVEIPSNGGGNLTFVIPNEAISVLSAKLLGMPESGAAGTGKDIDFYTDYGQLGESPTTHQESDTTTTYDFTGLTGIISQIADLVGILTNAIGGDIVGVEVDHNSIGGAIQYLGVQLTYEVEV